MEFGFFGWGVLLGFLLGSINLYLYKKILVGKAESNGLSNVEFIFGKPYVIMSEKDYVNDCTTWYNK